MNKAAFRHFYPTTAKHPALSGYMETNLTLPEIQAQIARNLLTLDLDETQEYVQVYKRFLIESQAPDDIAQHYMGDAWILVHASVEQLRSMQIFIVNIRNWGENRSVAPSSYFCAGFALQGAGIAYEHTWESEIPEEVRHCGPFRAIK